MSTHLV